MRVDIALACWEAGETKCINRNKRDFVTALYWEMIKFGPIDLVVWMNLIRFMT